jgi:hypothetical protein
MLGELWKDSGCMSRPSVLWSVWQYCGPMRDVTAAEIACNWTVYCPEVPNDSEKGGRSLRLPSVRCSGSDAGASSGPVTTKEPELQTFTVIRSHGCERAGRRVVSLHSRNLWPFGQKFWKAEQLCRDDRLHAQLCVIMCDYVGTCSKIIFNLLPTSLAKWGYSQRKKTWHAQMLHRLVILICSEHIQRQLSPTSQSCLQGSENTGLQLLSELFKFRVFCGSLCCMDRPSSTVAVRLFHFISFHGPPLMYRAFAVKLDQHS